MRKSIVVLALLASTAQALADQYQIIPTFAGGKLPTPSYAAFVLNTVSGEAYYCWAESGIAPKPHIASAKCTKNDVVEGSIPPGSAVGSGISIGNVPPAIWKINQANGDVTFCASVVTAGNLFAGGPLPLVCALMHLNN
jgi:hypothetical protein